MRPFAFTVLAGLLSVAGINFYVDPSSRFLRAPAPIASNWGEGQGLVVPYDFDERRERAAHIAVIPAPDLVFLGSSRVMLADGALFPGLKVYNAGVSGATVEDYAASWQTLKEAGKVPRYVILFVDPWAFNRHSNQVRWKSGIARVRRFVGASRDKPLALYGVQARLSWQGALQLLRLEDLADLLSWSVLKTSVRRLRERGIGPSGSGLEGTVIALSALPPDRQAWRSDGALVYMQSAMRPHALEEIRRIAADYAAQEDVYSLWHFEFDEQAYALLGALLRDMRGAGAQVLAVLPPYEPTALRMLSERPAYRGVVPAAESALARLSDETQGAVFCDAADASQARCEETEFMDGMHMLRPCLEKVLYRCLDGSPAWRGLIPGSRAGRRSARAPAGGSRR